MVACSAWSRRCECVTVLINLSSVWMAHMMHFVPAMPRTHFQDDDQHDDDGYATPDLASSATTDTVESPWPVFRFLRC